MFGLTVGNLITLPAVIIQREFEAASFGMLVGLSTAIGQFTCVVGPGLLGFVREPPAATALRWRSAWRWNSPRRP